MLGHSLPQSRELARAWRAVLGRLELEVSGPNFETWLADTRALSRSGIELVVEASSSFRADWLNDNLLTIVDRCAAAIVGEGISVRFVAPGTNEAGHRPETAAVETASTAPETIGKVDRALTLARYFRADGNALAILSCLNLIDAPETAISPVLVHGAPGLGKTHLLHGLASCAKERGWRVACLTGEGFLSRYQRSLRDGSSEAFQDANPRRAPAHRRRPPGSGGQTRHAARAPAHPRCRHARWWRSRPRERDPSARARLTGAAPIAARSRRRCPHRAVRAGRTAGVRCATCERAPRRGSRTGVWSRSRGPPPAPFGPRWRPYTPPSDCSGAGFSMRSASPPNSARSN